MLKLTLKLGELLSFKEGKVDQGKGFINETQNSRKVSKREENTFLWWICISSLADSKGH